jgi:hypothetical protein
LERQTGFADPARAGQREQAHIRTSKDVDHSGDLALAPDQRGRLGRQVGRMPVERSQRWELGR